MKFGTAVLVGLGAWATYELYKNRSLNAALNSMKEQINALKNKVSNIADKKVDGISNTQSNVSTNQIATTTSNATTPALVSNNGVWAPFVGQPVTTSIIAPNDSNAVVQYSGVNYNDMFRRKADAFRSFSGWD